MALQISAPIEKVFILTETDKTFGCEDGEDPTQITIKQATQAQHEHRQGLWDELIQEIVGDTSDPDAIRMIQRINLAVLNRLEVFLTMTACNIKDESGKDLFHFGGKKMTEQQFKQAWGKLPPMVANEIHEKVREVNISWGPGGEAE